MAERQASIDRRPDLQVFVSDMNYNGIFDGYKKVLIFTDEFIYNIIFLGLLRKNQMYNFRLLLNKDCMIER